MRSIRPASRLAAVLSAAMLLAPPAARAGDAKAAGPERRATSEGVRGVVELFTSQGCSSCPPADRVFATLSADPGLVVLAYHVDYWDYIGWQDVHGSRENTERQRAYAKALGSGTIYTPQAVVNGRRDVIGSREGQIRAALADDPLDAKLPKASVSISVDGKRLRVGASPAAGGGDPRNTVLMLVTFDEESATPIERGENKGLVLVDRHAVRDWRILGMLGDKPLEAEIPIAALKPDPDAKIGCAAILQTVTEGGEPGPIIAAATIEF